MKRCKNVYMQMFDRMGMENADIYHISSGGSFSKYSYEFQTLSEAGEDEIYIIDEKKKIAINKQDFNDEILKDFNLSLNKENLTKKKSIEVGDIYSLGHKYSEAIQFEVQKREGRE